MQTSEDFFFLRANPRGFTNPGTEAFFFFLNQLGRLGLVVLIGFLS